MPSVWAAGPVVFFRPEATSAASAHHAPFVGLEPDVVSLNAALSATEKAATRHGDGWLVFLELRLVLK